MEYQFLSPEEFLAQMIRELCIYGIDPSVLDHAKIQVRKNALTPENAREMARRIAMMVNDEPDQDREDEESENDFDEEEPSDWVNLLKQHAQKEEEPTPQAPDKEDPNVIYEVPTVRSSLLRVLHGVEAISTMLDEINQEGLNPGRIFAMTRIINTLKGELSLLSLLQVYRCQEDIKKYGSGESKIDQTIENVLDYASDMVNDVDQMLSEAVNKDIDQSEDY